MPMNPVMIIETQRPLQIHCPFNGAEEVYCEYDDTAGKHHWVGTMTGHYVY